MAYDEELAEQVRTVLADRHPTEQRMVGGLAFMVDGRMAVCVSGAGGLLLKVGEAAQAELVARVHVDPMVMGRRESTTWVRVDPQVLSDDDAVREWVERGYAASRGTGRRSARSDRHRAGPRHHLEERSP